MSYPQVCEGYNKRALVGNWYEERLYQPQPFRESFNKLARDKDQAITCFDGTGFQRALPRLSRKPKWQTTNRVILNDGIKNSASVMKAEYPSGEQESSTTQMRRPFNKNMNGALRTATHPYSELKNCQRNYSGLKRNAAEEMQKARDVIMYGSDFRSTLPQHPSSEKLKNFNSTYMASYYPAGRPGAVQQTNSLFHKSLKHAGNFNPAPEESLKPITTMVCELKKQMGDEKEVTGVQRSWVPSRDKALQYSKGFSTDSFRKANMPKNDIQTSLNMNIGVQNIHPKVCPDSYFKHVRQDVTMNPNKPFGSKP